MDRTKEGQTIDLIKKTMLLPGHIAAGYLISRAVLHFKFPDLPPDEIRLLVFWAMLFAALPDIDNLYAVARNRSVKGLRKVSHREFITHRPLFWLLLGLSIIGLGVDVHMQLVGGMILIGAGTHLLLDSIELGIAWLWPFHKRLFSIRKRMRWIPLSEERYWEIFKGMYVKNRTFAVEVALVILAVGLYWGLLGKISFLAQQLPLMQQLVDLMG